MWGHSVFQCSCDKASRARTIHAADGPTRNSQEQSLGADGGGEAKTVGRKGLVQSTAQQGRIFAN